MHAARSEEVASGLWLRTERATEVGGSKARGLPAGCQEELPDSRVREAPTLDLTGGGRLEPRCPGRSLTGVLVACGGGGR